MDTYSRNSKISSIRSMLSNSKFNQTHKAELHIFCDASTKAYGAVAYWRFSFPGNKYHISLIIAKNKVVPNKGNTTIPRLELQAALIGTRLAETIEKEHEFEVTRRVFWSDSEIVLKWINKDPVEFKIFVANRLSEIREKTNVSEWRWINSENNRPMMLQDMYLQR